MRTSKGLALITNGRLVDGTGAPAVEDAAVLIRDGMIRPLGVERLATGDAQPSIEDAGPLGDHGVGDGVHVSGADDDIDPGVDIGGGAVAARRGRRLVGVLSV